MPRLRAHDRQWHYAKLSDEDLLKEYRNPRSLRTNEPLKHKSSAFFQARRAIENMINSRFLEDTEELREKLTEIDPQAFNRGTRGRPPKPRKKQSFAKRMKAIARKISPSKAVRLGDDEPEQRSAKVSPSSAKVSPKTHEEDEQLKITMIPQNITRLSDSSSDEKEDEPQQTEQDIIENAMQEAERVVNPEAKREPDAEQELVVEQEALTEPDADAEEKAELVVEPDAELVVEAEVKGEPDGDDGDDDDDDDEPQQPIALPPPEEDEPLPPHVLDLKALYKFPYRIIYHASAEKYFNTVDFGRYQQFVRTNHAQWLRSTSALDDDIERMYSETLCLIRVFGEAIGITALKKTPERHSRLDISDQLQEVRQYVLGFVLGSCVAHPSGRSTYEADRVRNIRSMLHPTPTMRKQAKMDEKTEEVLFTNHWSGGERLNPDDFM